MKTIKQLLITIAVLLCSATTYAYDFEVDGIYYNIISATDFTAEVCEVPYGGEDYTGDIVIPSTVIYDDGEYSVIFIEHSAFSSCTNLTSITIPNGVTSIGKNTFEGCTSLSSITIPNGVTSIEESTFSGCSSLSSVTIGYSVEDIGESAFSGCSSLTDIYLAGIPPKVGNNNFTYAQYMNTTLYVPEGLLERYKSADVWRDFINIKECDNIGIEDTYASNIAIEVTLNGISFSNAINSTIAIYNINGVLVKRIDKYAGEEIILEKGVYIISAGNKTMKIKL